MISPYTVKQFLKYFDSIDYALSLRMSRTRVWDEEALTFLLTDLLDIESQKDFDLKFPYSKLIKKLNSHAEPLSIQITLETHSYDKKYERYVSQSDLGLIIDYQNYFQKDLSFKSSWLFQAKRLFKVKDGYKQRFTVDSKFESIDKAQEKRMLQLRDWAECDFIRYMLYCPRPSMLDKMTREILNATRTNSFKSDIFDYTLGLELRDDLLKKDPTVAAGIFISKIHDLPKSFKEIHAGLNCQVFCLSWFIVTLIFDRWKIIDSSQKEMRNQKSINNFDNPKIDSIVRGNLNNLANDSSFQKMINEWDGAKFLPKYSLNFRITNSIDRPQ